jgi:hypothetical protein
MVAFYLPSFNDIQVSCAPVAWWLPATHADGSECPALGSILRWPEAHGSGWLPAWPIEHARDETRCRLAGHHATSAFLSRISAAR